MRGKSSCIKVDDGGNTLIKGFIPGMLCGKPHVGSPGLELMTVEDAANSLTGDALYQAVFNEFSRQLR